LYATGKGDMRVHTFYKEAVFALDLSGFPLHHASIYYGLSIKHERCLIIDEVAVGIARRRAEQGNSS
jgi:hypothetical protein